MGNKIFINVILLFSSLAFALLLSELLIRLFFPQPILYVGGADIYQPDELLGWVGKPNVRSYYIDPDTGAGKNISMNNFGLRMINNISLENSLNKKRIVLLGDSFTEGAFLNDDETIQYNLQKIVSDNYEVINFGVGGYGTVQSIIRLKEIGLKLNPDLVILFFYPNDFGDNYDGEGRRPLMSLVDKSGKTVVQVTLPETKYVSQDKTKGIYAWLKRNSHLAFIISRFSSAYERFNFNEDAGIKETSIKKPNLFSRMASKVKRMSTQIVNLDSAFRVMTPLSQELNRSGPTTINLFKILKSISKENKFNLVIVNLPTVFQLNETLRNESARNYLFMDDNMLSTFENDRVNKYFTLFFDDGNIDYFDLFYTVEFQQKSSQLYFKNDAHWNAEGSRVASKLVYDYLNKSNLIYSSK